jgi:DNA-binding XRE family transcriptional regulator
MVWYNVCNTLYGRLIVRDTKFFASLKNVIFGHDDCKNARGVVVMFGLGKGRSRFGKWLDRNGLHQNEIAKKAKVSTATMTRLCNESDHVPKISTWVKVQRALKSMGYDVDRDNFFDI